MEANTYSGSTSAAAVGGGSCDDDDKDAAAAAAAAAVCEATIASERLSSDSMTALPRAAVLSTLALTSFQR